MSTPAETTTRYAAALPVPGCRARRRFRRKRGAKAESLVGRRPTGRRLRPRHRLRCYGRACCCSHLIEALAMTPKVVPENRAKQGRKGRHVMAILVASLSLAVVAAIFLYLGQVLHCGTTQCRRWGVHDGARLASGPDADAAARRFRQFSWAEARMIRLWLVFCLAVLCGVARAQEGALPNIAYDVSMQGPGDAALAKRIRDEMTLEKRKQAGVLSLPVLQSAVGPRPRAHRTRHEGLRLLRRPRDRRHCRGAHGRGSHRRGGRAVVSHRHLPGCVGRRTAHQPAGNRR